MRLLFLGTGPFAVPTFEDLVTGPQEVVGLVTRPTPPQTARRGKVPPNPMREAAERLGVPVHAPGSINDEEGLELLRTVAADLLVVCDYGQILSNDALACARLGGINLHGSLLPKYRGAAPVHWSIYQGDTVTGVSVIHMTPRLDGGPLLVQKRLDINPEETQPELELRLSRLGISAVREALEQLETWDGQSPLGRPQDPAQVTKAPRLQKSQGAVDWSQSATQLQRQVRAFQPWPGSFTWWHRTEGQPLRLVLLRVSVVPGSEAQVGTPGTITEATDGRLHVQTGHDRLSLDQVHPAGKKPMAIDEFLRGHPCRPGERLGPESPSEVA